MTKSLSIGLGQIRVAPAPTTRNSVDEGSARHRRVGVTVIGSSQGSSQRRFPRASCPRGKWRRSTGAVGELTTIATRAIIWAKETIRISVLPAPPMTMNWAPQDGRYVRTGRHASGWWAEHLSVMNSAGPDEMVRPASSRNANCLQNRYRSDGISGNLTGKLTLGDGLAMLFGRGGRACGGPDLRIVEACRRRGSGNQAL